MDTVDSTRTTKHRRLSSYMNFLMTFKTGVLQYLPAMNNLNGSKVEVGDWVAGIYDSLWLYGQVKKLLPGGKELRDLYFQQHGGKSYVTFSNFERKPTYVPWCQVVIKFRHHVSQTQEHSSLRKMFAKT